MMPELECPLLVPGLPQPDVVVPNLEIPWDARAVWSFAGRLTAVAESAVGHSVKPLLTIHSIPPRRDQ
jgi:hypothetical protein